MVVVITDNRLHQAVLRVYHLHEHASRGRLRRVRARVDMVLARPERVSDRTRFFLQRI